MALKRLYRRGEMLMDAKDPENDKNDKTDTCAHLSLVSQRALERAGVRKLTAALKELQGLFEPPLCERCVGRVLAIATARVLVRQAAPQLQTLNDLEEFVSLMVHWLAHEYQARQTADAQAATTTPPPQVH